MAYEINEKTTGSLEFDITSDGTTLIPLAQIDTATLTLYDLTLGTIINSRDNQNIKNANNVVITSAGHLTWSIQEADSVLITATNKVEIHGALFRFKTTGTPPVTLNQKIDIKVINLTKVT